MRTKRAVKKGSGDFHAWNLVNAWLSPEQDALVLPLILGRGPASRLTTDDPWAENY